jgi:assimilatory nitrate reductase catalytic subunit
LSPNNKQNPELETLSPYRSVEEIWNEHRTSTAGRDLDITGLSYQILEDIGPQQWPMPSSAKQGKKRLYEDGIFPTSDGKAHFIACPYVPTAESGCG